MIVRVAQREIELSLNKSKFLKFYPFLKGANQRLTTLNKLVVNNKLRHADKPQKKSKSREEQKKTFQELLNSGKVKNRAALARQFNVSRAWVTKVLNG